MVLNLSSLVAVNNTMAILFRRANQDLQLGGGGGGRETVCAKHEYIFE